MDELAALTHRIEYLFLKKLISGLRDESITVDQAKQMAQEFLVLEPFNSSQEAQVKLTQFVTSNPQFTETTDYINAYENEKDTEDKIALMRQHIKQNNIQAALEVAKL